MRFEHRDGWVNGRVALTLRERAPLQEDGTFEVPEDLAADAGLLQRLVDAGHDPVDPDALPDGVDNDSAETDDTDTATESAADAAEDDAGDKAEAAPDDDLDELDRSELWELAHSDEFEAEPGFDWNESTEERLREWIREQRSEAE